MALKTVNLLGFGQAEEFEWFRDFEVLYGVAGEDVSLLLSAVELHGFAGLGEEADVVEVDPEGVGVRADSKRCSRLFECVFFQESDQVLAFLRLYYAKVHVVAGEVCIGVGEPAVESEVVPDDVGVLEGW